MNRDCLHEMDLAAIRFRGGMIYRTGYLHAWRPARPRVWRAPRVRWDEVDVTRGLESAPPPSVTISECGHTRCAHGIPGAFGLTQAERDPAAYESEYQGPRRSRPLLYRGPPRSARRHRAEAPAQPPTAEPHWRGPLEPARAPLWATVVYHDTDGEPCRTVVPDAICGCGRYAITWYEAPDPRDAPSASA